MPALAAEPGDTLGEAMLQGPATLTVLCEESFQGLSPAGTMGRGQSLAQALGILGLTRKQEEQWGLRPVWAPEALPGTAPRKADPFSQKHFI